MDEAAGGGATVGIVGSTALGPTVGATVSVGTAGVALTPRLLISVEPNGIPVRATPPGAVGAVEVGVDDETTLLEPEPHIPDIPAVSIVPEVAETPDVPRMLDELDMPDEVDAPDIVVLPVIAALPAVVAVAGDPVPIPIPPPSKLAVDPNIEDGDVPTVEHAVPLAVLGIVIVPVTPVGAGLSPGEVISVEPSGIPVGPTDVPGLTPSGDVASRVCVVTIAPTCAMAPVEARSAGSIARLNENLNRILRVNPAAPRPERIDASERVFAISITTASRTIRATAIGGIDSGRVERRRAAWSRSKE
ncbi:hypothetical protein IVB05_17315 [Bradyrhizobium sp. 170]|nr:hypothetical protein IVB05_17315 [Bradyrhizobium sp. 170]